MQLSLKTIEAKNGGRGEVVIYQPVEGEGRLEVRLEEDTLWLSLNQLSALFERDKSVISRHLRNVFREGELDRKARPTKSNISTSMLSYPSATASIPCAARSSASGRPRYCGITRSRAIPPTLNASKNSTNP
jgi:hypothetical protein